MLTPKERLEKVLNHQEVDRPPCICPGGMMNMVTEELMKLCEISFPDAHQNPQQMADLSEAVYKEGCFENYGVPFCMTVEAEEFGADIDMGSNIYEPHVINYNISSVSEWEKLEAIDFSKGRSSTVIDAIKILKAKNTEVPIIGNITGPISTASSIMEPVVFYKELRKNNEKAHEYMTFITKQITEFAIKQIEAGADIIAISDPSGTGEILGPKLFDEFAVKYINQIIAEVKRLGKRSIVHICGQMKNVYKEVNKIESDVLSFDSIVSISEAKKNLGNRLIMGNVSTYTIEFGEMQKIADMTKKCVLDGSDIISPACGLGMKSSLKNVRSMLSALTEGDAKNNA
ncbi:uroporphyrinogen decarboxylase family protein [Acetoanaerobium noterae]|uniref:uroporphyrinogen decarboxylase family protein n=1 Tax=Acetoanaerobium noterae TaxID=745369 RepID=UPI0032220097